MLPLHWSTSVPACITNPLIKAIPMKKILIILSLLIILVPILAIVQNLINIELISLKEYFYLIVVYLVLVCIYLQDKKSFES